MPCLQVLTTLQVNSLFYFNRSPVSRALYGSRRIKTTLAGVLAQLLRIVTPQQLLHSAWADAGSASTLSAQHSLIVGYNQHCPWRCHLISS